MVAGQHRGSQRNNNTPRAVAAGANHEANGLGGSRAPVSHRALKAPTSKTRLPNEQANTPPPSDPAPPAYAAQSGRHHGSHSSMRPGTDGTIPLPIPTECYVFRGAPTPSSTQPAPPPPSPHRPSKLSETRNGVIDGNRGRGDGCRTRTGRHYPCSSVLTPLAGGLAREQYSQRKPRGSSPRLRWR